MGRSKEGGGIVMNFSTLQGALTIRSLIDNIQTLSNRVPYLIGIDGCGGAGKSSLAKRIERECPQAEVIHMDDFYLPSSQRFPLIPKHSPIGCNYDWRRLEMQVLKPLSDGAGARYQRYDWETDQLAEWHNVQEGGPIIIEGTYSIRKELSVYYDYTIWVECPRWLRLERGLDRDGETARPMWEENWMVFEDLYIEEHQPMERAGLVVDGTQ